MSYLVLRGPWCNIIVFNVHTPSEEKSDDTKDSFYEELERVFDHVPKYHVKLLLTDIIQNLRGRIFSNRQLGMRVYIRIVMIMVLEQ